jgi:elongin-A
MEGSLLRKRLLRHLKLDLTSWKDLRARKEKRVQEIGARIKSQRLELEERKKQKEIKFTDRVPPMKRARGCECYCAARIVTEKFILVASGSSAPQQKSLFQKTRSEASKIQRTMFEPRMRPPMPAAQTNRARIRNVVPESPSPSQPTSGTRVIVRPAVYRPSPKVLPATAFPASEKKSSTPLVQKSSPGKDSQSLESAPRLKQSSLNAKKEPTCSLFMPKHRAHSQLTSRLVPSRGSPTK